jgi:hypothetical protein
MVLLAAAAISHCERLLFRVSTRRLLLRLLLRQHIVRWIELIFGRVLVFVDVAVHRSAVLVVVICPKGSKEPLLIRIKLKFIFIFLIFLILFFT